MLQAFSPSGNDLWSIFLCVRQWIRFGVNCFDSYLFFSAVTFIFKWLFIFICLLISCLPLHTHPFKSTCLEIRCFPFHSYPYLSICLFLSSPLFSSILSTYLKIYCLLLCSHPFLSTIYFGALCLLQSHPSLSICLFFFCLSLYSSLVLFICLEINCLPIHSQPFHPLVLKFVVFPSVLIHLYPFVFKLVVFPSILIHLYPLVLKCIIFPSILIHFHPLVLGSWFSEPFVSLLSTFLKIYCLLHFFSSFVVFPSILIHFYPLVLKFIVLSTTLILIQVAISISLLLKFLLLHYCHSFFIHVVIFIRLFIRFLLLIITFALLNLILTPPLDSHSAHLHSPPLPPLSFSLFQPLPLIPSNKLSFKRITIVFTSPQVLLQPWETFTQIYKRNASFYLSGRRGGKGLQGWDRVCFVSSSLGVWFPSIKRIKHIQR